MTSILNNVSNFLWTRLEADNKPALLSVTDNLLPHWNFPSHHTEINDEGLPKFPEWILINLAFNNKFISNFGIFGTSFFATLMLTSGIGVSLLPSLPALFTYSAISFSAKVLIGSYANSISRSNLLSLPLLTGSIYCAIAIPFNLFYLANAISFIAFNLLIGITLKFLAYKVYPQVQAAYDKFFAYMKAGDKDPRADSDRTLSKHFAKKLSEQNLPSHDDVLLQIISYLSSKDALQYRLCNKQIFCLISNRSIVIKKLIEAFPEVPFDEMLDMFNEYPLNSSLTGNRLNKRGNFIIYRLVWSIPRGSKELKTLQCIMKEKKFYWTKSPVNGLFIGQKTQDGIVFYKPLIAFSK